MTAVLFAAQRVTAFVLAAAVTVHLGTILYATRGGLTAADILARTSGNGRRPGSGCSVALSNATTPCTLSTASTPHVTGVDWPPEAGQARWVTGVVCPCPGGTLPSVSRRKPTISPISRTAAATPHYYNTEEELETAALALAEEMQSAQR